MTFKNEETYVRAELEGTESCYHRAYEKAAEELRGSVRESTTNYPNHIDGLPRFASKTFKVLSPGNEDLVVGLFQRSTPDEVREAIASARRSFLTWSREDWEVRVKIFERAADLMRRQKYALAAAITLDNGKNRHEAIGDVDEAIDFIEYYCSEMRRTDGFQRLSNPAYVDEEVRVVLRPYGTWAVICPFNFPLAITTGMTTGVLLTGNTAVLKPSSTAPLPVHLFYEILAQAGLPNGVLNLVAGGGEEVGGTLAKSPQIDGVVFTGSRDVGLDIMRSSPVEKQRPIIAEMGSKNPVIVSGEADLDEAADGVVLSAFGYSGQKCSACSRVYVQDAIYEDFMTLVVEKTMALTVGDPFAKDTFMGPVITRKAMENYLLWSDMARRDGKVLMGGKRLTEGGLDKGFYVQPTVVEGLPEDHELVRRELFVPILCVQRYRALEDAVERANATDFGLTAGIFSKNEVEIKYFFDRIEFGVTYANRRKGGSTGAMVGSQAFSGWKGSGSTGKGTGSRHYLQQFLREQSRTISRA